MLTRDVGTGYYIAEDVVPSKAAYSFDKEYKKYKNAWKLEFKGRKIRELDGRGLTPPQTCRRCLHY